MRRHRGHLAAATVLAALATTAAQCDDSQDGSTQNGGQGGGRPAASARSTPPSHGGKPSSGKPSPNQRGTTPPPDPYTGFVEVSDMRPPAADDGSNQVSCSALDAQFTVTPYHAGARWRAVALDYDPPNSQAQYSSGNIARDVVLQPSSGTLELGQSATVHISGRYASRLSPADFWIIVQAPDPHWRTRISLHLHCIGR